jgi:hypothetical protein
LTSADITTAEITAMRTAVTIAGVSIGAARYPRGYRKL